MIPPPQPGRPEHVVPQEEKGMSLVKCDIPSSDDPEERDGTGRRLAKHNSTDMMGWDVRSDSSLGNPGRDTAVAIAMRHHRTLHTPI